MIPLGTDRPLLRPTLVTYVLVVLNVAIAIALYALGKFAPADAERFVRMGMLSPRTLAPLTFVSYAFLHAGWMHLLGNMVALWVFGPNVEDRFGRVEFLALYLAGSIGAGAAHCVTTDAPVIGASGAIAGVTGAYIVLFPRTQIKVLFFMLWIGIYWIPAAWFIGFSIVKDLFWLAASTNVIGSGGARVYDAVARTAHLGGYALGAGVSMVLLWTGLLKREVYDLFSIGRQAMRRRQLRELSARAAAGPIGPQGVEVNHRLRKTSATDARTEALALARSAVVAEISAGRTPGAVEKYRALLREFGDVEGAGVLPRRPMGEIATALYLAGDHATAATAYEALLAAYPRDPEAPRIRLLLGLINARYLNDPLRAKAVLTGLEPQLSGEDEKKQARELLADLA